MTRCEEVILQNAERLQKMPTIQDALVEKATRYGFYDHIADELAALDILFEQLREMHRRCR